MNALRHLPRALLALSSLGCITLAGAQEPSPAGHWEGAIDLPGTKLEIRLDLQPPGEAGAWSGAIDIPAQMVRGLALADVSVQEGRVSFKLPTIPGDPVFEGALAGDGARLTGEFRQSGQTFPFTLEQREAVLRAGETPSRGLPGEGLPGHWQGSLRIRPVELRLVLHVAAGEDGALTATIDSIDQGKNGIPVSSVALDERGGVRLELARIRASYEGGISADGSEITGNWKQGARDIPLVFRRLAAAPELARPQEPKKPYPYLEHEVRVPGGAPGVTLAGALTMPRGAGPFPAVVLLSGSGAQDRDETLLGHRPFLVLADHLTRAGIAVLRYDDRGVGRSTGKFSTATHEDFAADARAAFQFLKTQPDIDATRVGLCGHSEGALHAAIVAAGESDPAFVVMLAGVGVPIDQLLTRQSEDLLRVIGSSHVITPEVRALNERLFEILRQRGGEPGVRQEVRALLHQIAAQYPEAQREAIGLSAGMIRQQEAMLTSPWFIKLLAFDPAPVLARVRCSVLALNGEKDIQVAFQENLEGIRRGLAAGGNVDVTTKALLDRNHLFQHCQTGAITEYGAIEETMSPEVLALVCDWIQQRVIER